MNLSQCRQELNNALAKSNSQNISQITNLAWGNSRNECISAFWWLQNINNYVKTVDHNSLMLTSWITTTPVSELQTSTQEVRNFNNEISNFNPFSSKLIEYIVYFYIAAIITGVILLIFWIIMLIDIIKNEKNNKAIWIIVLLLGNCLGAIIYYFAAKRWREKEDLINNN